jgi:hypothetical protein
MSYARRFAVLYLVAIVGFACWFRSKVNPLVEGLVVDHAGPVVHAAVGWQGERIRVLTDAHGRFRLRASFRSPRLIAHKPGYHITSILASERPMTLRLEPVSTRDNDEYGWIDPHPDRLQVNNCANCHTEIFREWKSSVHAHSATNPRFLHLFAGTDGRSPEHQTWNARAEHPDGAGVCAKCHAPTLSSPTLEYDVREAAGVTRSGIHCDYCHKVADAPADKLGTRFGRDGLFLLRPASKEQLFFGPLDDAVRKGESFVHAPYFKESRYCASCHEGTVFGVHAYGTYSEWLASPAKRQGKQCQDCHMAPTGTMTNIAPGKGGIERHPATLASHRTPGGTPDMLRRALSMTLSVKGRAIDIEITAANVGHRVPTGFPDRHLVLFIEAFDGTDRRVDAVEGPRLPGSAGQWTGAAGTLFAKQIIGEHGRTPLPFWLPVFKIEDTRLRPDQPERRTFVFPEAAKRVTARLWYRRFWQEVADARGWRDNDTLIIEKSIDLP